jgi:hypothetical protein
VRARIKRRGSVVAGASFTPVDRGRVPTNGITVRVAR